MRLRGAPYGATGIVYLLEGVAPEVLRAFPAALADLVQVPAAVPLRSRLPRRVSAAAAIAAAESAVRRLPDGAALIAVAAAARRAPYGRLPITIAISGDRVAVDFSHAAVDGTRAVEAITWLVTRAAGGQPTFDARRRAHLPLVRALAAVGPGAVRRLLADRRHFRIRPPAIREPSSADLDLATANVALARLDPGDLAALRATGHGMSTNTIVASAALSALRAVHRGSDDLPVVIPIDLRRWLPNRRVDGNFIAVDSFGTLLASDWSAAAITARIADRVASGVPVLTVLYVLLRYGRGRLRRGAGPERGTVAVSVPIMRAPSAWPASVWIDPSRRMFGAAALGPWPSSTQACVVRVGDTVSVTAWDETGLFDVDAFAAALRHEVRSRRTSRDAERSRP